MFSYRSSTNKSLSIVNLSFHHSTPQRKDTHIRVSFPIVCLVLAEARSSNDD